MSCTRTTSSPASSTAGSSRPWRRRWPRPRSRPASRAGAAAPRPRRSRRSSRSAEDRVGRSGVRPMCARARAPSVGARPSPRPPEVLHERSHQAPAAAARRATALSLLAGIAADPGSDLTPGAVELVAVDFADGYAAAPADMRAFADATLDRLDSEAGFAALSPDDSLAVLRTWSVAGRPDGTTGDPSRTH